jgi:hypothetical protein
MFVAIALIFAFVFFIIAAITNPVVEPWRHRLVCFGLAAFVLAAILYVVPLLHL